MALVYNGIVTAKRLAEGASKEAPVAVAYDWNEMRVLAHVVDAGTVLVDYETPGVEMVAILDKPVTYVDLMRRFMRYELEHDARIPEARDAMDDLVVRVEGGETDA